MKFIYEMVVARRPTSTTVEKTQYALASNPADIENAYNAFISDYIMSVKEGDKVTKNIPRLGCGHNQIEYIAVYKHPDGVRKTQAAEVEKVAMVWGHWLSEWHKSGQPFPDIIPLSEYPPEEKNKDKEEEEKRREEAERAAELARRFQVLKNVYGNSYTPDRHIIGKVIYSTNAYPVGEIDNGSIKGPSSVGVRDPKLRAWVCAINYDILKGTSTLMESYEWVPDLKKWRHIGFCVAAGYIKREIDEQQGEQPNYTGGK